MAIRCHQEPPPDTERDNDNDKNDRPKDRDRVLEGLAEAGTELWRDENGTPRLTVPGDQVDPYIEILEAPGSRSASIVRRQARSELGRTPNRHLITDVLTSLQGDARDGPTYATAIRVASLTRSTSISAMTTAGWCA